MVNANEVKEHVVAQGETLSGIAMHYYNDGSEPAWRKIYDANKDTIGADPNLIKPGQKLVIPSHVEHHKP